MMANILKSCLLAMVLACTTPLLCQTLAPSFDTITVTFKGWGVPYIHQSSALDTTSNLYKTGEAADLLSFSGAAHAATRLMEVDEPTMGIDTARYERFRGRYFPAPADSAVLTEALGHDIVILNEAHHEPRHRVFTRSLLQGLYNRGFHHFGLEALTPDRLMDSLINTNSYPTITAGYYVREPQLAALIAEARRIGFQLFSYETFGVSGRERELGQMRNIIQYRSLHPEGKLLLYVGYAHAMEGALPSDWEKAMAQRLADSTGLDPLTVDQTHFREMSDTLQERFEYRYVAPKIEVPTVYLTDTGNTFQLDGQNGKYDIHVFHPRTTYRAGRPDYVWVPGRQAVYIDCQSLGDTGPWLLQAYGIEDDMSISVPRDVVETSRLRPRALALPPGRYRLLVQGIDGRQWVATIEL